MSGGALPGRGLPMATNHPIHRHTGHSAASSSRQQTCGKRAVVLLSHEQTALGHWPTLLAPYLDRPATGEEEESA